MGPVTRSQSKQKEYAVAIDFDGASKAWRSNKNTLKNGCFSYKKPVYNLRSSETPFSNYNLRSREPSGCLVQHYEAAF
jgi:hypothetical protein